MRGLYSSLYGKTGEGLYAGLYARNGATTKVKSSDIRLGGLNGLGDTPLFARQIAGIPVWLIGIGLAGFAYVIKKRRAA